MSVRGRPSAPRMATDTRISQTGEGRSDAAVASSIRRRRGGVVAAGAAGESGDPEGEGDAKAAVETGALLASRSISRSQADIDCLREEHLCSRRDPNSETTTASARRCNG
jgi:hypothetical protein